MRSPWESGGEKDNFEVFHIFRQKSFLKKFQASYYLTKEPPSRSTFQVQARLYVKFIAVRKYNFLDFFGFTYKILAVTILNIIPLTERAFQSRMLTSLRKSRSVSIFSLACFRLTQCAEFLYFLLIVNAFLVSVCTKAFAYFLC